MVGCYKQISCTNTALTWRLFALCVLLPSIDLVQKSVSQNFIFYTMKRTLKALFSTSQVWDSTKTVLHNYFFQMSYSSVFYMPISSSFVWIPAKRGKQDTKSKQAAGTHWWQPPLAKGSTVQRATEGQRKEKEEGKVMLHLRAGHNLQDWFLLGWNDTKLNQQNNCFPDLLEWKWCCLTG